MHLDLKQAMALQHRSGHMKTPPDSLYWLFMHLKHHPIGLPQGGSEMNKAHELGASVWNHAWRQFGELAEGVLQNWKLETGQGLSQALHELVEMQAVTLGLGESLSEYQSLGPLKMLNHVAGDPK